MVNYLIYMVIPVLVRPIVATAYHGQSINSTDKIRKRYLLICGLFIFAMFACRHYSVGSGDGAWYYNNWIYLSNLDFDRLNIVLNNLDIENGYLVVAWLLSHVFSDPQFLFIIYGALVSISVCIFLYKYCEDLEIGLVMFNCLGLFSFMVQGIRQGIAMCICLFAIDFALKRKPITFVIIILFAMTFHASAIVFVIVYFLPLFKINVKSAGVFGACSLAGFVLIDTILNAGNSIINDHYAMGDTEFTNGGYVSLMIYIMIIIAALLFTNNERKESLVVRLFFYITVVGLVAFVMRYSVNSIMQRVGLYFMFGQMIMLPAAISHLARMDNYIVRLIVTILCLAIAVYKVSYSVLLPYTFFFQ